MEKKNKSKIIIILLVLVVLVLGILLLVNKFIKKNENVTAKVNIVNSLTASSQAEIDDAIESDLKENKYSLENAKVYVNPYGSSPLSALIVFKTDSNVSVDVTVKGKNNDDITMSYDKDTYHYIPVYALYDNYENTVEIKLSNGTTTDIKIPINEIENKLETTVNTLAETKTDTGLYFITSPLTMNSFAYDAHGELRWYTSLNYYHSIVPLDNGHMLIGTDDINSDALATKILEIDYLGRIYKEYNIEEGYLNDIYVKEDGNILLASKNSDRKTFSDYIIEIDKNTGKIVKTTDVYKLLENIDSAFTSRITNEDYFYNSGIEYNESTDTLLLTYWGGEAVMSIKYSTGTLNWIFSNPDNFTSNFNSVLLQTEDGFVYPKAMHSASLDGNTLTVFDNGYSTIKGQASTSNLVGSYSSANTYEISGNTIKLVSSYDEDKKLFSYALGDYKKVSSDESLILFGRELTDVDYSSGININEAPSHSRLIEKKNGKTVLDLTIGIGSYSVNKISVNKMDYSFDLTSTYTTLLPNAKEELTEELINQIESATITVPYDFGYDNGFIENNAYYMLSDEVKLILINDNKEGTVYTLKVKDKEKQEKILTDLSAGKYYVYLLENNVMMKTDKYIEIK